MTVDKRRYDRIPAEQITDVKNWYPPDWANASSEEELDDEQKEQLELQEEVAKPFTADQLESIHQEAYNEGYEEGFEKGREEGRQIGSQQGLEEGKKQGYQDGLKEGQDAGRLQAFEAEKQRIDQQVEQLKKLLKAFENPIEDQLNDIEEGLFHIAIKISKAVIHHEISINSEYLQSVIKSLVAQLPVQEQDDIKLLVSQQDADVIQQYLLKLGEPWKLQVDGALQVGDCQIKTKNSVVDFCLEKRFQDVLQQLSIQSASLENTSLREGEQEKTSQEQEQNKDEALVSTTENITTSGSTTDNNTREHVSSHHPTDDLSSKKDSPYE